MRLSASSQTPSKLYPAKSEVSFSSTSIVLYQSMSIKSASNSTPLRDDACLFTPIPDSRLYDQPKAEPTMGLEVVETSPPSQVVPELCNPVPTKTSYIQYFHLDKLYTWCALFVSLGGFMFGFDTFVFNPILVIRFRVRCGLHHVGDQLDLLS